MTTPHEHSNHPTGSRAKSNHQQDLPPPHEHEEAVDFSENLDELSTAIQSYIDNALELVRTEWKLSIRLLVISTVAAISFACLLTIVWLLITASIAMLAYNYGAPIIMVVMAYIAIQILSSVYLWKQLEKMISLIGFKHTKKALFSSSENTASS